MYGLWTCQFTHGYSTFSAANQCDYAIADLLPSAADLQSTPDLLALPIAAQPYFPLFYIAGAPFLSVTMTPQMLVEIYLGNLTNVRLSRWFCIFSKLDLLFTVGRSSHCCAEPDNCAARSHNQACDPNRSVRIQLDHLHRYSCSQLSSLSLVACSLLELLAVLLAIWFRDEVLQRVSWRAGRNTSARAQTPLSGRSWPQPSTMRPKQANVLHLLAKPSTRTRVRVSALQLHRADTLATVQVRWRSSITTRRLPLALPRST